MRVLKDIFCIFIVLHLLSFVSFGADPKHDRDALGVQNTETHSAEVNSLHNGMSAELRNHARLRELHLQGTHYIEGYVLLSHDSPGGSYIRLECLSQYVPALNNYVIVIFLILLGLFLAFHTRKQRFAVLCCILFLVFCSSFASNYLQWTTTTDGTGSFVLDNGDEPFPPGQYRLTLSHLLYFSKVLEFSIASEPTTIDCGTTVLQKRQNTFCKSYGGLHGNAVIETMDGGFIACGTIVGPDQNSGYDMYLVRTDSSGNLLWSRSYAQDICEEYNQEEGLTIKEISQGNYVAFAYSAYNCGSMQEGWFYYFIETDEGGNDNEYLIPDEWNLTYISYDMILAEDNSFIVLGGNGIDSTRLGKFSNHQWAWNNYYSESGQGFSVSPCNDGGYLIAGKSSNDRMLVMKVDDSGIEEFSKAYGGVGARGHCGLQLPSGEYIVCGSTESSENGGKDFYYMKLNAQGDEIWSKTFGSTGDDEAFCVIHTHDNCLVFCGGYNDGGSSGDQTLVLKTDLNGSVLWSKVHQGHCGRYYDGGGPEIQETQDNGFIICNTSSEGLQLTKLNSNGDL